MLLRQSILAITLVLSGALSVAGCGGSGESGDQGGGTNDTSVNGDMIYADGWKGVEVFSGGATVTLDPLAHFHTTYTPCFQERWGAISLKAWNRISENMNKAVKARSSEKEKCFKPELAFAEKDPKGCYALDYDVKVKKPGGTTLILEKNGSGEICSKTLDPKDAVEMLKGVNELLLTANTEECPGAAIENRCPSLYPGR